MHSTIRNEPARNVDRRVRAPETFTLIIVWPIMAQPPMPPKNPVTMLAMPWPMDSRVLEEWVSVMSSTSLAVISDPIRPTRAIANAYGAIVVRVSRVKGTSGSPGTGRDEGSSPLSPTVGTAMPAATVMTVRMTMDTRGAGMTLVILGKSTMSASPPMISGYTTQGTSRISGTWAMKIRMARASTKPTITERGTNRISFATPRAPRAIWMIPARMTAAIR